MVLNLMHSEISSDDRGIEAIYLVFLPVVVSYEFLPVKRKVVRSSAVYRLTEYTGGASIKF